MAVQGSIDRRRFVEGAAAASAVALGALAASGVAGSGAAYADEAEDEAAEDEAADEEAIEAEEDLADGEQWDYEADLVVVGCGTSVFGTIEALHNGKSVVILEKASAIGGTTILSGGTFWVPMNHKLGQDDLPEDYTEEEIFEYVDASDLYHSSTDEAKLDYIENAHKVFEQVESDWGYAMKAGVGAGDYYDYLPYAAQSNERSMRFADPDDGSTVGNSVIWEKIFIPELEDGGATILTDTEATELIQDDDGRVIGVLAGVGDETICVKADSGVLMGAGGFDNNEDMCRRFLRAPIEHTYTVSTNTGDGQRMGMAIGADLSCMTETLGGQAYVVDGEPVTYSWCCYGTYSILINQEGRRFVNEGECYGTMKEAFSQYSSKSNSLPNLRSYLLFTQDCIDLAGAWPDGSTEQPDWAVEYQTFDEFAEAVGIDADVLEYEIERYNGFCETGVDLDFARGGQYELRNTTLDESLPNPCLGQITEPFYVGELAVSSLGTRGGLMVNTDSQVLDVNGNVIEGLYACGTDAGCPLGGSYAGGGASVGPGYYQSYRAVNHMFELGKI